MERFVSQIAVPAAGASGPVVRDSRGGARLAVNGDVQHGHQTDLVDVSQDVMASTVGPEPTIELDEGSMDAKDIIYISDDTDHDLTVSPVQSTMASSSEPPSWRSAIIEVDEDDENAVSAYETVENNLCVREEEVSDYENSEDDEYIDGDSTIDEEAVHDDEVEKDEDGEDDEDGDGEVDDDDGVEVIDLSYYPYEAIVGWRTTGSAVEALVRWPDSWVRMEDFRRQETPEQQRRNRQERWERRQRE